MDNKQFFFFFGGKFLQCGDQKRRILKMCFGKNAKKSPYFEEKKVKIVKFK
jgi:hypothetical protein